MIIEDEEILTFLEEWVLYQSFEFQNLASVASSLSVPTCGVRITSLDATKEEYGFFNFKLHHVNEA